MIHAYPGDIPGDCCGQRRVEAPCTLVPRQARRARGDTGPWPRVAPSGVRVTSNGSGDGRCDLVGFQPDVRRQVVPRVGRVSVIGHVDPTPRCAGIMFQILLPRMPGLPRTPAVPSASIAVGCLCTAGSCVRQWQWRPGARPGVNVPTSIGAMQRSRTDENLKGHVNIVIVEWTPIIVGRTMLGPDGIHGGP